jgi:hypothetical protein
VTSLDAVYFEEPELELDIMATYPTKSLREVQDDQLSVHFNDSTFEHLFVKEGE